DTGRQLRVIELKNTATVAWKPDGTSLVIPGKDDQISIYDAATGEPTVTMNGATGGGVGAVFDSTGTMVLSHGWAGRLRLWDAVLGRQSLSLHGDGPLMCSLDNRIFIFQASQATCWQVDPVIEYRTFAHISNKLPTYSRPSLHRDGRILAEGTDQGVVLWD